VNDKKVKDMQKSFAEAYQSVCDHTFSYPFEHLVLYDTTTISVFENEIPAYVECELVRLYGNLYSSILNLRIHEKLHHVSTYVVQQGADITTLLLFKIEHGRVTVLNEVIHLSEEQIEQFASTIFARLPHAKTIVFTSIITAKLHTNFIVQRINWLEDIVVLLPDSEEKYLTGLGKNTRRNIKRYSNKLHADFPTIEYELREREMVKEDDIRAIIQLNEARMADKKKVPSIKEIDAIRMIQLVRQCGLVCFARIDGNLCAGAISYRVGKNYFLTVLAHHPDYNDYSLGILCCKQIIAECIRQGAQEFHFLWGRYDYKYALGGVQHDLDRIIIYRSAWQVLFNASLVLTTAWKGYRRKIKLWLQDSEHDEHTLIQLARRLILRLQKFSKRV
jgi:hypothetical protein